MSKEKDKELKSQTIFMPTIQLFDGKYGIYNNICIHHPIKGIRKRVSYAFWKPIVDEMKWMPFDKMVDSVSMLWNQMDRSHKFNTMKQAGFELESMTLCLLEARDEEVKEEALNPVTDNNFSVFWNKEASRKYTSWDAYVYNEEEECEELDEEEVPF
jgi:hypothetical protein